MHGIRTILIFFGILSDGGIPCGAFFDMPIERGGHFAVGVEQQNQDDSGEFILPWTETEHPAVLK